MHRQAADGDRASLHAKTCMRCWGQGGGGGARTLDGQRGERGGIDVNARFGVGAGGSLTVTASPL